ncbi:uncharacterized protein MYCFIDRAFT_33434 [Pseudocercospora fijiensis CIRAD86]|uniref:F-box domain-containing protein n=1 Tax=Pseudocercospora fijiensis (strain CIRAD86) TaxID=383855 RepID=M3AKF6_PSEFD|nr:uncharacterized protein MYCFIDRAFT_33434 [Pseudocercospora fijiensis CIRAD86]EME77952.1 hypothetical protein MYCFIDRAFT_33434 [Pseudocercospora fijiensis CIRAD86]
MATNSALTTVPPIFSLPDELLQLIVAYLPPDETVAFGKVSKRSNKITYEPLVWRRHCIERWKYWESHHGLAERLDAPPAQTKWQQLYYERSKIDHEVVQTFNELLTTQQFRYERMETIAQHGYDIKDLMMAQRDQTSDDAEDVLCRRYFADAVLGQIHRTTALEKWQRLHDRQMVQLEEVLGSYDLFVLSDKKGDLSDIDRELDRLAQCIRDADPEFDDLSIRMKALCIARYLRSENLVGNTNQEDYHALRNNFLSWALFEEPHTSLPLQSVAIYCAVARRLEVNARPSNYPQHVHAVIEAPQNLTLDGKHKLFVQDAEPELMHMDPWRTDEEVSQDQLRLRLLQMGVPSTQHMHHLGASSTIEMALRTGRNIMTSVQEARERQRNTSSRNRGPDIEAAWYSMLWSMLVLGSSNAASDLHRRRQCLPYLIEHFQKHYPEDINLVEKHIPSMFEGEREHTILLHLITTARKADQNKKAPSPRDKSTENVAYKIGHHFRHKRYGYEGVIIGWNMRCTAEQRWIEQMRVDDLPRGREQPFYNAVANDKSTRYVAEENIEVCKVGEKPSEELLRLAGRYFKRWDAEHNIFVSNIKDEFPDD